MALSIVIVVMISIDYWYLLQIKKYEDLRLEERVNICNAGLWKSYFFYILLNLINIPPSMDFSFSMLQVGNEVIYTMDAVFSVVSLFRLVFILRLLEHFTHWTDESSQRVCKLNGVVADSFFALKAYLKLQPYMVLTIALILSTFILGFALRSFEMANTVTSNEFEFAWNAFWVIILTMTTIGYGDIYPVTHFGRISAILACIWGVFILSLFVVALTVTTEFNDREKDAYDEIKKKSDINSKIRSEAGILIKNFITLTHLRKKK